MIVKNMLTQIDPEGMSTALMESIADFKKYDSAVSKQNKYLVNPRDK